MINQLIHRLLKRRHFWRHATFSEVAELYASRLLRLFALRLVSAFTSVYLFQEGFSVLFIVLYWAAFYGLKVPFSWPGALLIARFGPKHATLVSNIVSSIAMVALPFVTDPVYGAAALAAWLVLQAFSGSMNDLAYLVDFSKVKNVQHAGKELGYMNIVEKIAAGSSPVIGGFTAYLFGPESIMVIAAVFFMLSAVPLLLTAEPIKLQKGLNFRRYPWRMTARSFVAQAALGFDVFVTGTAWSLFLVLVVFVSGTDRVYAEIGVVTSVTLFIALLASYGFGRLIDHRKGGELLRYATRLNSVVHVVRMFVTTPVGVVLANAFNEAATAGYSMPFMRGMFDLADRSGKRIEYLFIIEMAGNFGAMIAALVLAGLLLVLDAAASIQVFFLVAAFVTLLITSAKFPLYRR
ncbi:MAG: MFS transporter [Patescibacteria group bacterium]